MADGITATLYKRPNGRTEQIKVRNIRDEDAAWFSDNCVAVSFEDCGFDTVIYADCGLRCNDDPDEGPDEIIVFSGGRRCEDAMTELRRLCEVAMAERTIFRGA